MNGNAEKAFDKIHHPLIIKTFNKLDIEGAYFNKIKAICNKLTSYSIMKG